MPRKHPLAADVAAARATRHARLAQWAQQVLGHEFADIGLLDRALTHGSASRRTTCRNGMPDRDAHSST